MTQTPPPFQTYIGFGDAVKLCLNKYADFSGRASRAEFWWFYLFTFIISWIFSGLELITGSMVFSILDWLVMIALLIPSLAVSWRRMHDIGKGGGWIFINLIPLVGWIIWIVWCCKPGEPAPNRFGPETDY